jgi:hypothetical protein
LSHDVRGLHDDVGYQVQADAYIVSSMFAEAYRRRHGGARMLLVPDTGPSAVRALVRK